MTTQKPNVLLLIAVIVGIFGIIAMVLPQFFLDNVRDHARDIIAASGVNMLSAYRLPDNLFANAKKSFLSLAAGRTVEWTVGRSDGRTSGRTVRRAGGRANGRAADRTVGLSYERSGGRSAGRA